MKLVSLITVRVITSGLMLVCMALTSPIYGFDTRFACRQPHIPARQRQRLPTAFLHPGHWSESYHSQPAKC